MLTGRRWVGLHRSKGGGSWFNCDGRGLVVFGTLLKFIFFHMISKHIDMEDVYFCIQMQLKSTESPAFQTESPNKNQLFNFILIFI